MVPEESVGAIVSVFHHQFGCLPQTTLATLLKRHFFAFDLETATAKYVQSCTLCAAKRDKKNLPPPMSSVQAPAHFGEQFATDIISREKQKILVLRETATSYTAAKFVKNEQAKTLESGLRQLFAQFRPPNQARPTICRIDNASAFKSLAGKISLADIGVELDLANPNNKNSNPVAEKANREMHKAILTVAPQGGKLSESDLAAAVSILNSKPRWSTMSSIELWTGRDMVTGETLIFDQKEIINEQKMRREKTHKVVEEDVQSFEPGDIVYCNNEGSKLKARNQLIVRERLENGMYRLDRLHEKTGYITRAFLPARELYAPKPLENFEDARGADKSDENTPVDIDIEEHVSDNSSSQVESQERPERQPTAPKPVQLEEPRPVPAPIAPRRRPIPVAPGRAADYVLPLQRQQFLPFYFPVDVTAEQLQEEHEDIGIEMNIPADLHNSGVEGSEGDDAPPQGDIVPPQEDNESNFSTAESHLSSEKEGTDPEDRPLARPAKAQCPRPSPPQQPVMKRQRSGSAPPVTKRPQRTVRQPVRSTPRLSDKS